MAPIDQWWCLYTGTSVSGLALIKGPSQINVVIKSILIKTLFRPIGLTNKGQHFTAVH